MAAQITNIELKRLLDALRIEHDKSTSEMHIRVDKIEERMNAYEKRATESGATLDRVESKLDGYDNKIDKILRFLKWLLSVATGVLIAYIASIVISHFHP
jgi:hypothetical protein